MQLSHWNFIPQIKGNLNQFSDWFTSKYTLSTNDGSFLNNLYQLSVILYDYLILLSNFINYLNAFNEYENIRNKWLP